MDDRDLVRHLQEGGEELFDRAEPPRLDLDAITGSEPRAVSRARHLQLRPLVAAGAALACVAVGVVVGAAFVGDGASTPAPITRASTVPTGAGSGQPLPARVRQVELRRFAADAPSQALAEARVFTATDGRTVDLRVHGLAVPPRGQFYELWILGNEGKMVSLGVVRVDDAGMAHVRMPLPVSLRRFPVFDLSLEQGDGNPAHSGHSLLRSAAAA